MPAKIEGTWRLPEGDLTLKQDFQKLSGTLTMRTSGATPMPIADGRLRGDEIAFTAGGAVYNGRVTGRAMKGTVVAGGTTAGWTADRVN